METLKKICNFVLRLFKNENSIKVDKKSNKIVNKNNKGVIVTGDAIDSIIAAPGSNVNVGADVAISEDKPSNQKNGDIWIELTDKTNDR